MIFIAVLAVTVGTLAGATGIGGFLLIPALMIVGGMQTHHAMATVLSSFFVLGIFATWSYQRHGSIDWKITVPVLAGSFISSYAGAYAGAFATARQLDILLASIIIVSSSYALSPKGQLNLAGRLSPRGNTVLLSGIGVFVGFLCGMTGAGGGILSVPVMLLCGYPVLATIGCSQVLQSVVSLSGSVSNFANGFIDFSIAWWITLCQLTGVMIGVRIAHTLPLDKLKKGVTWFCLATGIFIACRAFVMH